jgi:hypothetical protein
VDTKKTVQSTADEIKQRVGEGTETLQAKAVEAASQAKNLTDQGWEKVPPPVASRIEPLMATARQRPLPTAVVAVVMLLVLRLALRRLIGTKS